MEREKLHLKAYARIKRVKNPRIPLVKFFQVMAIYSGLIFLGIASFAFPPVGLPVGILMFHSTKRHYALFPLVGVLALVFFTVYNNLFILMNT